MLVTQKLTECRIKNATFERRKQREREGAEKDTRLQGRRRGKSGENRVEKNREQREDTCQHTPHKANVQGHETITDAKQESGNKPGERGRWGSGLSLRCM